MNHFYNTDWNLVKQTTNSGKSDLEELYDFSNESNFTVAFQLILNREDFATNQTKYKELVKNFTSMVSVHQYTYQEVGMKSVEFGPGNKEGYKFNLDKYSRTGRIESVKHT